MRRVNIKNAIFQLGTRVNCLLRITCSTTSTAYELPLHFCEPSNFEPLYNNVLGKPNCFDCDGGGGVKSTLTGIIDYKQIYEIEVK